MYYEIYLMLQAQLVLGIATIINIEIVKIKDASLVRLRCKKEDRLLLQI